MSPQPKAIAAACAVAACAGFAAPSPAIADERNVFTTRELVENCRLSGGNPFFLCIGYLRGVIEAELLRDAGDRRICPPAFAAGERRRIFMTWYRQANVSPAVPAAETVRTAFAERFPCPRKSERMP